MNVPFTLPTGFTILSPSDRVFLAAHALSGILASCQVPWPATSTVAALAVEYADAVLARLQSASQRPAEDRSEPEADSEGGDL